MRKDRTMAHLNSQTPLVKPFNNPIMHQRAHLFWLTGLSGAGKTTLAYAFEEKLRNNGYTTYVLDGDNMRNGLCCDLSFSYQDRFENIRRVAEVSKLFLNAGLICIAAFISPTRESRALAQSIVGAENFSEIYIRCTLSMCEMRDVKGNYRKARAGTIENYTGISAIYEEPLHPSLIIDTENDPITECVDSIVKFSYPKIFYER